MRKTKTSTDLAFKLLADIALVSEKKLIKAFDSTVEYNCYKKKKRGGTGFRNIAEPPKNLKDIQSTILNKFFYQLWFRRLYLEKFYYTLSNSEHLFHVDLVFYQNTRRYNAWQSVNYFFWLFDHRLTGLLPKCSYVDHPKMHAKRSVFTNFVTTIDFKDAFPSIKKEHVVTALEEVLLKEVEYYSNAYISRLEIKALRQEYATYEAKFQKLAGKDRLYKELLRWCDPYFKIWSKHYVGELADNWENMTWAIYRQYFEKDDVYNILNQFVNYKEYLREKAAKKLGKTTYYFEEILRKTWPWKGVYTMRHPLFGSKRGQYKTSWFRELIREEVKKGNFNCPQSKEVVTILAKQMAELLTHNGELPQGVPTSGFILCLIVSQKNVLSKIFKTLQKRIPKTISIYSDDIVFATNNRPTQELKNLWAEAIESTGIFKVNYRKFRTIDRRQRAPAICGLKLTTKTVSEGLHRREFGNAFWNGDIINGAERANRTNRPFVLSSVAIAKEKQKRIRAMFHQGLFADVDDPIHNKLRGYVGYIHQVYGRNWPNQLFIPYKKYRQRFKSPEPKPPQ